MPDNLLFDYQLDDYNGIVLEVQDLPRTVQGFSEQLTALLTFATAQSRQLIWFTLSIEQSIFIHPLTEAGFVFHNCLETQITLILRLKKEAYAPFVPTHSIGAGALIFNQQQQILVIREHLACQSGFKLPGGHIELGEKISQAIVREVYEETGIRSEFIGIQGFASKEVFRFGKSNLYFLCRLKALSSQINIQDVHEIAQAKWCDVDEFINDSENSAFVREIVAQLQTAPSLQLVELGSNSGPYQKQEVFSRCKNTRALRKTILRQHKVSVTLCFDSEI